MMMPQNLYRALLLAVLLHPLSSPAQDAAGQTLYSEWCVPCHGVGEVASLFLEKRYQGSVPGVLKERTDVPRELVLLRIRTQIRGMPAFRPTEISDSEAALIADYLSGDKSND